MVSYFTRRETTRCGNDKKYIQWEDPFDPVRAVYAGSRDEPEEGVRRRPLPAFLRLDIGGVPTLPESSGESN